MSFTRWKWRWQMLRMKRVGGKWQGTQGQGQAPGSDLAAKRWKWLNTGLRNSRVLSKEGEFTPPHTHTHCCPLSPRHPDSYWKTGRHKMPYCCFLPSSKFIPIMPWQNHCCCWAFLIFMTIGCISKQSRPTPGGFPRTSILCAYGSESIQLQNDSNLLNLLGTSCRKLLPLSENLIYSHSNSRAFGAQERLMG